MDTFLFVYVTIVLVMLVQVPIAIDLLRFMYPNWKMARMASGAVHTLLFAVMGCIFCIGLSYHLFVYLPILAGQEAYKSVKGLIHIAFALWVWMNVVVNYYYSVTLHPGKDRDYKPPSREPKLCYMSENGVITEANEADKSDGTRKFFYCAASQIGTSHQIPKSGTDWKPSRIHYCKICECAIPYLDHHCPFTGNCAGLRNYSNFFLGLCYGALGLFYAVVITMPYFMECNMKNVFWYIGIISNRERSPVCQDLGPHTFIFLPVFAGFLTSFNLLLLQIFFLASDLSTYNVLSKWSKFPMLRFMFQRIKARKFLDKSSRLNVLIRSQRKGFLWYLVPTRNNLPDY